MKRCWALVIFTILVVCCQPESFKISHQVIALILLLVAHGITLITLWLLIKFLGKEDFKKGVLNFLIGDEGTYSLSRLQAAIWSIVIISFQIALAIGMTVNTNGNYFSFYEPVFSESTIWLLGFSLSSYVLVKGITVSNIQKKPTKYLKNTKQPSLRDLLVGDNGLDFSRCQMLIWTVIALIVYLSKCFYFLDYITYKNSSSIVTIFSHTYELNAEGKLFGEKLKAHADTITIESECLPYVPYLPWSFIVLMGLSQGAYIGKKLIPTFKLDDLKDDRKNELQNKLSQLAIQKQLLEQMSSGGPNIILSDADKFNLKVIKDEIAKVEDEIDNLNGEINQINNALNLN